MIFTYNGMGVKFFLLDKGDAEYDKKCKLITDNGGEISTSREFPVITLSNGHNDTNGYPVFHTNYIEECIKRSELLNLIDFKLGSWSFWGCLDCIFTHTQRTCPHLDDTTRCFTSTQIDSSNAFSPPISVEHDYAQLQSTLQQTSNSIDFDDSALFSPDDTSASPITASDNINRTPEPIVKDAIQKVPEPSAFEELCSNEIIPGSDESDNENTNRAEKSSSKIETVLDQRSVTNNDKVHWRFSLSPVNAIEVHPLSAAEEAIETRNDELETIEQDNRNRISDISRCSRVSTALMSERSSSPMDQNLRTSPTILRDGLNNIKILGLGDRRESVGDFRLDSSDSDDTNYELLTDSDYSESKKEKETDNNVEERKCRRKEIPGSSGIANTSNPQKNRADSSTKPPDDLILISNSDSSSSDDAPTSALSVRKSPPAKAEHANSSQLRKVKHIQPSRNFLHWEQQEMVRYLIDNDCIAEARGNRVWKQLIADGLLPHRTYHSLNNHFRKFILPSISRFKMRRDHAKQFRKLQSS